MEDVELADVFAVISLILVKLNQAIGNGTDAVAHHTLALLNNRYESIVLLELLTVAVKHVLLH